MSFADVNGQHIYFEESGIGPAVAFSHGFLMDHDMFAPQVDALRDRYRCITWDERGFGRTEVTGPFSYWDSADDLLALLDHLDVERAVLVGMSQGGFLSMRAALRTPDRVAGLFLIGTQAGLEDEAVRPAYQAMADEWITNGPGDALAQAVASIIMSPGYDDSAWLAKWRVWPKERLQQPFNTLMSRDDITGRLGDIICPVRIVHGGDDASISIDKAELLCAGLPKCEGIVRVAGAGHAVNLSHPQPVNDALRLFCQSHL